MSPTDENSREKKTTVRFVHGLKNAAAFARKLKKNTAAFMRELKKVLASFMRGLKKISATFAHGSKKACTAFTRFLKSFPWKKAAIGIGVTLAVCLLTLLLVIWRLIASAPSIDSVDVSPNGSATWICDEDGSYLRKLSLSESNREIVTLNEIPDALQNAVVAIEDSRFYEHNGIDLRGIVRAFRNGITSGSFSEGASTITQQLIKNCVFTDWTQENSFAERFARKIQEQYLALQLEKQLSKEEILEDYLNTINFGSGCYGVEAAAQRYFGKEVSALTLPECAVLAAIPQNPTGYNPIDYPEANQTRQRLILRYMEEQGYITHEERMEALEDDVYTHIQAVNLSYDSDSVYSYYEDALIEQVTKLLMSELNYSYEQASQALYSGGLRIYSAQDTALQEICDEEFQNLANFPESTQVGVDYTLRMQETDGSVTTYSSETLRTWIRENINDSFDLLCETKDEAQGYADAFREAMLSEDSSTSTADAAAMASNVIVVPGTGVDSDAAGATDADVESDVAEATGTGLESDAAEATGTDLESDAVRSSRTVLSEQLTLTPQPQASLVLIEQETGFVRAIVGGREEKTASLTLNRASDTTRQPGSTFKILTAYAPALDQAGQTLATLYENQPYEYENGTAVSNWDITDYSGAVTIREAITRSINVVAVRCITEITPRLGFTYAENFGISTLVDTTDSTDGSTDVIQPLALGGITNGVTNLELCAAYAAIANEGMYATPLFFTKILDRNGNVLLDATGRYSASAAISDAEISSNADNSSAASTAATAKAPFAADISSAANAVSRLELPSETKNVSAKNKLAGISNTILAHASEDSSENNLSSFTRVLKDSTAYLLTSAMEDVISSPYGTAYGTVSAAGQPVAGKTGTTSSYKDIWFVGYTPYYTCSVWGGYDNNQSLPDGSLWHSYSRVLWTAVMERIHASLPVKTFEQPESVVEVTLCSETHLPAQENCPSTCIEFFAKGTEPDESCTEHQPAQEPEPESETEEILIYQELLDDLLPEAETEFESFSDSEAETAPGSDLDPASGTDTDSETESEVGDTITSETESDSNADSETNSNFEANGKPVTDTGTDTDSDAQTHSDINSDSNMKPESDTAETSSLDDMLNRLTGQGFSISP